MAIDYYKVIYLDETNKEQRKIFYRLENLIEFLDHLMSLPINHKHIEISTTIL